MDTNKSLEYIIDFARRIERMDTDPEQQRFVRELLTNITKDCPPHILKQIAESVLAIRRRELDRAGTGN